MLATLAAILGLVLLVAGPLATRSSLHALQRASTERRRRLLGLAFGIGALLAVASYFIRYADGPDVRVSGFPFPWAMYALRGGKWRDFVALSPPLIVTLNAIVLFLAPQIPLAFYLSRLAKRGAAR